MELTTLPARTAVVLAVNAGGAVEVVNTHGTQVVDTWALLRDAPEHGLSMDHTRARLGRVMVREGDTLFDDRRQPVLLLARDTSPGVHDTLIPACNPGRYRELGCEGYHPNCAENYAKALEGKGLPCPTRVPAPLNLFMNVPVAPDGSFVFEPPRSAPGDAVLLEARQDLWVIFSACPQDLAPTNGQAQQPVDVGYRVYSPEQYKELTS